MDGDRAKIIKDFACHVTIIHVVYSYKKEIILAFELMRKMFLVKSNDEIEKRQRLCLHNHGK